MARTLCSLLLVFCISMAAAAQNAAGIAGTVQDASSAVVIGALVTATNEAGVTQTISTNEMGAYQFSGLAAGTYTITVTGPGFRDYKSDPLAVAAGQTQRLDVTMELAQVSSTVDVLGQSAQVETQSSQLSGTVTQTEITNLGLNGRNFTQLIALAPGVSNQTGQDEAKVGVTGSVNYSVNGGRVEYNAFEVDGSDVLNAGINKAHSTLIVYPSLDAISEMQVLTSNYGAQYGRTASGTIMATTKSGTNEFHGSLYYFLRNEAFNAKNYFDHGSSTPLYRKHDVGFTIGGPVYIPRGYNASKEKTFFFFSEEWRKEREPFNFSAAVPSAAERKGDFSDVCPAAGPGKVVAFKRAGIAPTQSFPVDVLHKDPFGNPDPILGLGGTGIPFDGTRLYPDCPSNSTSSVPDPADRSQTVYRSFQGNRVPISPIAQAILDTHIIPLPNATSGCNSTINSCYVTTVSPPTDWREELFRVDHNFTPKLRGTIRYIHDTWSTTVPKTQWPFLENTFPTIQNEFVGPGVSILAQVSHTISSTLLNQISFNYTTDHITLTDINGTDGGTWRFPAGASKMGYLFNNGFGGKVPGVVIGGTNQAYGGAGFTADPSYMPWEHSNPTYNIKDDVSWIVGNHSLQFGGALVIYQRNEINPPVGSNTGSVQGILTFSNENSPRSIGNAFADLLYQGSDPSLATSPNAIKTYTQDSAQLKYYQRYTVGEVYLQDDWRVTPRFTLNLGLRVSLFGQYHEKYTNVYNWVPEAFNRNLASTVAIGNRPANFGLLLDTTKPQDADGNFPPIPLNLSNLDPRITNGLARCSYPTSCMKGDVVSPAPRLGFAWDVLGNGKMSVRGGYGIFFHHGTGNEANTGALEGSAPLVINTTQNFPLSYQCIGGIGAGCSPGGAYPLNVTAIPTQVKWPYVQQWSLGAQLGLPGGIVGSLAYVGSKGTDLAAEVQINQLQPVKDADNPFKVGQPLTTNDCLTFTGSARSDGEFVINGIHIDKTHPAYPNLVVACQGVGSRLNADANRFRPYPGIGRIHALEDNATSSYNALQGTLRRTQRSLTLGVSYAYSHSFDDSSDRSDYTFANSLDLKSNRASSNFDQRHLLSISYVYPFPFGRWAPGAPSSASRGGSGVVNGILGGWELSGITVYQSGTPFTVINAGSSGTGISVEDNAGVANGVGVGSYVDLVGDPHLLGGGPTDNPKSFGPLLLTPAAFAAPRGLTFGNAGRNSLNNPSRLNFDMTLLKHIRVGDSYQVDFRMETFNVFNTPQFLIYDSTKGVTANIKANCYGGPSYNAGYVGTGTDCLTGSAFLHPVSARRPRTMQFGLKLLF